MTMLEGILLTIITAATPLLFAAIGELVAERSGVLNLGVEGMMAVGAVCGFAACNLTGQPVLGLLAAMAAGMAAASLFGIVALRPQNLFGSQLPPLIHGVLWSLSLNVLSYVLLSLWRQPTSIERLQADLFVHDELTPMTPNFKRWRTTVTVQDLLNTVAQYLGPDRALRSFEAFAAANRVSIDRGALGPTVIGKGTKIDNLVQIAHNVSIGDYCLVISQVGIAGSTKLGSYVILAGQAGIAGHLKIGNRVTIAAQAGVMYNIPDGEKWLGAPAQPDRQAKRQMIAVTHLPDLIKRVAELEKKLGANPEAE